jgi:hypothetical protein
MLQNQVREIPEAWAGAEQAISGKEPTEPEAAGTGHALIRR